jgi:predicted TIM-barrel fold metal-dependent hydrolase
MRAADAKHASSPRIIAMTDRGLIDVHQHMMPPVYIERLAKIGVNGSGEAPWPDCNIAKAIDLMDRTGIATAFTSISSPGLYFGDVAFTRRLARECNEWMAELVRDEPDRFGAFAALPLPDVDAALRELEYALDTLKLDGVNLVTHVAHRYMGHPEEWELYAELDRRRAVVFVHPVRPPLDNFAQFSYSTGLTELVFDTTRAMANLMFTGALARFPNIRFILPHAGGVTPYLLFRLSGQDRNPRLRDKIPDGVAAYLRRLYSDVAQSAAPLSLRALSEVAEPDRVLFGTDFPFALTGERIVHDTIAGVRGYAGYDAAMRQRVERGNALALFPRLCHE